MLRVTIFAIKTRRNPKCLIANVVGYKLTGRTRQFYLNSELNKYNYIFRAQILIYFSGATWHAPTLLRFFNFSCCK